MVLPNSNDCGLVWIPDQVGDDSEIISNYFFYARIARGTNGGESFTGRFNR